MNGGQVRLPNTRTRGLGGLWKCLSRLRPGRVTPSDDSSTTSASCAAAPWRAVARHCWARVSRIPRQARRLNRICDGTTATSSTQPCVPPGGRYIEYLLCCWSKGGNVTSAGWQVTLCDLVWHVSSGCSEAIVANCQA